MIKNILLYENWGEKFWEIGPESKKNTVDGYSLSPIKSIDDIAVGDRIYHTNSGPGSVDDIDKISQSVHIDFDQNNSSKHTTFSLPILIKHGTIQLIEEEPEEGNISTKTSFNNNPSINISPNNTISTSNITKPIINEDDEIEEEEEEDDDDDENFLIDITAEELMTMKIDEFFNEGEMTLLVSIEDVENYKERLKQVTNNESNPFKIKLHKKRIKDIGIISKYYNHLKDRFPNMDIYRFNGQIPYEELWNIRQKDRVSVTDDMYDNHIFNSGVIFFWVFKDAVVFKTI